MTVLGIIIFLFVLLLFLIRGLVGTVKEAWEAASVTPTPYPTLYVRITPTPTLTPTISPTPGPIAIIDPGHGGTDAGTDIQGTADTVEKTINLEISKFLKEKLEALGFTVIVTRSADTFVSVSDRIKTGKNVKDSTVPAVFISIHQNAASIDLTDVSGCEIYYNDTGNENNKMLAESVLKEVCEETGAKERGVKTGDFDILSGDFDVPAILIECGFMTSDTEYELLKSDDYREKIAEGIVSGLLKYFKKAAKTGN